MVTKKKIWKLCVFVLILLLSYVMCQIPVSYIGKINTCVVKPLDFEEIKTILIGRCEEYQRVIHPDFNCTYGERDCHSLWENFTSGLKFPYCNVSEKAFEAFVSYAKHNVNKQMFWSGVRGFVHQYSNKGERYMTLEDTLTGYMVNNLQFCERQLRGNGESYGPCPASPEKCNNSAMSVFWRTASRSFAQASSGHIFAMFNASRSPVIGPNSFFKTSELAYFRPGIVTKLTVFIINSSPSTRKNPCLSDPSIKELEFTLEAKGIDVVCEQNPRDAVYLYCADNPSSSICDVISAVNAGHHVHSSHFYWTFVSFFLFLLTVQYL